jgi:hypothetical protein
MGRCARLGLEILEPRFLLTASTSALTSPLLLPPGQVAPSNPAAPVTLHLPGGDLTVSPVAVPSGARVLSGVLGPGGDIDLYAISVGPTTGSLRLDLTGETPAPSGSGSLSVFDAGGNLLIGEPATAGAISATIVVSAPVPATGEVLYVAVSISGPADANSTGGGLAYRLGVTPDALAPASAFSGPTVRGVASVLAFFSSTSSLVVPTAPAGQGSSGSGPPTTAQQGTPVEGPWPSRSTGAGAGTPASIAFDRNGDQSPSSPSIAIGVGPLPASRYEAAGGIFADGRPADDADRIEETLIEMSVVRLLAPVRGGSLEEPRSSEPDPATSNSPGLDAVNIPTAVLVSRMDRKSAHEPRLRRPGARPPVRPRGMAPVLPPPPEADPLGALPSLSAAVLPPIDRPDRRNPDAPAPARDEETADASRPQWGTGRDAAILAGVSMGAVLSVGLYLPDLAATIRRVSPRLAPRRHHRPAPSRDE